MHRDVREIDQGGRGERAEIRAIGPQDEPQDDETGGTHGKTCRASSHLAQTFTIPATNAVNSSRLFPFRCCMPPPIPLDFAPDSAFFHNVVRRSLRSFRRRSLGRGRQAAPRIRLLCLSGGTMRRVWILAFGVMLAFVTATGAAAQTVSSTTGAINGKVIGRVGRGACRASPSPLRAPRCRALATTVTGEDGTYRFPGDSAGRISSHLRTWRIRHGRPRGRHRRPRLHRDDQCRHESGVPPGDGHRHRRVAGR